MLGPTKQPILYASAERSGQRECKIIAAIVDITISPTDSSHSFMEPFLLCFRLELQIIFNILNVSSAFVISSFSNSFRLKCVKSSGLDFF